MKFGKFITFLFLIYETFLFYFVMGQTTNGQKSDCTLIYNFLNNDTKNYSNTCCSYFDEIICDNENFITYFKM